MGIRYNDNSSRTDQYVRNGAIDWDAARNGKAGKAHKIVKNEKKPMVAILIRKPKEPKESLLSQGPAQE